MHIDLENACAALDTLANSVLNAWGNDATLIEQMGWNTPAITRHDLAGMAKTLASDIRSTDADSIDNSLNQIVKDIPRRIQLIQSNTVPHMFNGNGGQAIPAYISTLLVIRELILPSLGWQKLPDSKALPSNLARRAKSALAELDQLTPDIDDFSKKLNDIKSAHALAENLPSDLQTLTDTRDMFNKALNEAVLHSEKIKEAHAKSTEHLAIMESSKKEAEKLISKCEEAYHITTTKGLAGAWDERAGKLNWSMWAWVLGLVIALGIGSFIGSQRLEMLTTALAAGTPNWGIIITQVTLSVISVGAPLWFAWLATKQIGQLFRLKEDYAYKASAAKSYEGHRKEAARIDPKLETRLFNSALARLEEPPLRLVESSNHGSPWHELINSDNLSNLSKIPPDVLKKLNEHLLELTKTTSNLVTKQEESTEDADVKRLRVAPIKSNGTEE